MSRIVINCPECYKQITLNAHSNVRIIAKEKAVHVHEDLEKVPAAGLDETAMYYEKKEGKITSPLKEQFEAVMMTYQPPEFFNAIRNACTFRRLYRYPDKTTHKAIFQSGEFTQEDMEYVLKKYDEVK